MVYKHPIISLDIMATIAELADAPISMDRPLDGVNLLPYLLNQKNGSPHDYLFWRKFDRNGVAVRSGDIKLVADRKFNEQGYSVYNTTDDISEKNDIIDLDVDKNEEMLKRHKIWTSQLKPTAFPTLGNHKWWLKSQTE